MRALKKPGFISLLMSRIFIWYLYILLRGRLSIKIASLDI